MRNTKYFIFINRAISDYIFIILIFILFSNSAFSVEKSQDLSLESQWQIPAKSSNWYDLNQKLYGEVLANGSFDILVLPFQVRDHAIDVVGRSLMTRYIVSALEASGKYQLPNPTAIEKALGEHKRRFDNSEVYNLANSLKVKKLVWGYVGHDNNGHFSFSIKVQERNGEQLSSDSPAKQKDWNNLEFSDEILPSMTFASLINEVTNLVDVDQTNKQKTKLEKLQLPKQLPSSLNELTKNGSNLTPLETAFYLQLLGILQPDNQSRIRERLFERSLIALKYIDSREKFYPILKTRAYYYLYRRPAALQILKNSEDSQDVLSLKALLFGDLAALQSSVQEISHPLSKLITQIELIKLFEEYNGFIDEKLNPELADYGQDWQYFIKRRIEDMDSWFSDSNLRIKSIMDEIFPVPGYTAEVILKGQLAEGNPRINSEIRLSVVEHVQRLFQSHKNEWCCISQTWKVTQWDYLDLLTAIAESNLVREVFKTVKLQGRHNEGLKLLQEIGIVYNGHPRLAAFQAEAKAKLARQQNGIKKDQLIAQADEDIINAFVWSNGQSSISFPGLDFSIHKYRNHLVGEKKTLPETAYKMLYISDFPNRPYWEPHYTYDKAYQDKIFKSNVAYTTSFFKPIELYYNKLDPKTATKFLEEISTRFIGNPKKTIFLAKIKRKTGDYEGEQLIYSDAITNGSWNWITYLNSGELYIAQGNYDKAQETFLKYPGFSHQARNMAVAISNYANDAGNLLFWRGKIPQAKSLYEISSETNTGSEAQLASRGYLAMMEGDFITAIQYSLERGRRYNSPFAYRDFMSLLHVLGENKPAWDVFNKLIDRKDAPEIWSSAFIGHRIQGSGDKEILDWLSQPAIAKKTDRGFLSFPARYAFMVFNIDRAPNTVARDFINDLLKTTTSGDDPVLKAMSNVYYFLKLKDYDNAQKAGHFVPDIGSLQGGALFPYFIWAHTKSKYKESVPQFLDNTWRTIGITEKGSALIFYNGRFNYYLGKALFEGGSGNHDTALDALNQTLNYLAYPDGGPIYPWFQLVEICEWLYLDSNNEKYLNIALDLARTHQIIQPMFAWAYAFEARYTKDKERVLRALAIAYYLDKNSFWISNAREDQIKKAAEWLTINNPFDLENIKNKFQSRVGS